MKVLLEKTSNHEFSVIIDVKNISDLLNISQKSELIIFKHNLPDGVDFGVEIYDDYRE